MTDDFAKRKELNGLGMRVHEVELTSARHDERISTLQLNTAKHQNALWQAIDALKESSTSMIIKISVIMGGIATAGFILTLLIQLYFASKG
ncbi:MAG: hypothetical protein KAU20_02255 [Nanoarchaeota archaeon]|nr:hypothetical protein [Nanoarchaeota archaeon]